MSELGESRSEPAGPGAASPPKAPRWVKVSAVIAIVIVLIVAALLVFGGGKHGPSRHSSSGDGATLSSVVAAIPHQRR